MLAFHWMFSSSSALQLRENTGSWELKSTFGCCRLEYVKMMDGDASLWESFPRALERRTGARRYVGAFRAPFQELRLTPSQEHALRVCSLLAIPPPPPDHKALQVGVPEDLSEDNLSTWADTVQDVAAGMIVLKPGMDADNIPPVSGASDSPEVRDTGGILSPVLPAGLHLQMPCGKFHRLHCIHDWAVVE